MATAVECLYTSCGCNRAPHCVDWGKNGLICYGACRAIAVCLPKNPCKVVNTLVGHTDRVNSVQWIHRQNNEPENELLSCSTDKTARLWRRDEGGQFSCVGVLSGHTGTVTQGRAVYLPAEDDTHHMLVATASVDSTLRIWERTKDDVKCIQTIPFGTGFVLDIAWIVLPGIKVPLLACGGDDQKIYLMVQQGDEFHPVLKLVGHEDWIRCLDLTFDDSGDVLLASSAQDHFIRIWRISARDPDMENTQGQVIHLTPDIDLKMKENTFNFTSQGKKMCYAVTLESVLQGHEHWVYDVHWQPAIYKEGVRSQPMCLMSVSMDKTMTLWTADPESGVWVEQVRVGAVGGNTLGLYGGVFSPDGDTILAHGYQGAFHMWHKQEGSSWVPGVTVGGHFGPVQDLAWDPIDGYFLLSASLDQTTRLHGYWRAEDPQQSAWHELARPQVHGYDMTCLAMVDRYTFASGADEKVVRVFQAPRNFVTNFSRICKVDLSNDLKDKASSLPEGASVPALGLSNKAVFDNDPNPDLYGEGEKRPQSDLYQEAYFSPLTSTEPPTEENLLQNTLWPEVQKLYGHGYEIFALACHPDGSVLASASKAAKAEHAAVLLWDRSTWHQVGRLESHALTVTQLAFSHTGRYLLSVSRDRTWALYERRAAGQPQSDPLYSRIAYSDKKTSQHSRIIWACAWSHDDKYFVTVSRDKKAIIWGWAEPAAEGSCLGNIRPLSTPLDLTDSVTAVDFAPVLVKEKCYLLAFGLDCGEMAVYRWADSQPTAATSWVKCASLEQGAAHHLTVRRLRFCPKVGSPDSQHESTDKTKLLLASCGADHIVKIHSIHLDTL